MNKWFGKFTEMLQHGIASIKRVIANVKKPPDLVHGGGKKVESDLNNEAKLDVVPWSVKNISNMRYIH